MTRKRLPQGNCAYCDIERGTHKSDCPAHTEPEVSGEEWEKEVWRGAVPSKTTKSGMEVVYDPNALITFIKEQRIRMYEKGRASGRIEALTEALTLYYDNVREWTPEFVETIKSKITSIREEV